MILLMIPMSMYLCSKKKETCATETKTAPKSTTGAPKSKRCNNAPGLLKDDPDLIRSIDCAENAGAAPSKEKCPAKTKKIQKSGDINQDTDLRSFQSDKPNDGPLDLQKTQELDLDEKLKEAKQSEKEKGKKKVDATQNESAMKKLQDDDGKTAIPGPPKDPRPSEKAVKKNEVPVIPSQKQTAPVSAFIAPGAPIDASPAPTNAGNNQKNQAPPAPDLGANSNYIAA
uniref:Uncharacterized protein n=1 Tax=Panagrolaimus sp. JU765 TaxID=591449 RepID=A0AC34QPL7_9BILA